MPDDAGAIGHTYLIRPSGAKTDSWRAFCCSHCGRDVSGIVVAKSHPTTHPQSAWLQCTTCGKGSVVVGEAIHPGVPFGPQLAGLPAETEAAYEEARRCMSINAYTAAEVLCRKILMHVAVDKRAKEGKSFAEYVSHLESEGYVTPPMKPWVELIRKHGNEANHELKPPDRGRAEGTVMFTAQLLRSVYEMEHLAKQYQPKPESN